MWLVQKQVHPSPARPHASGQHVDNYVDNTCYTRRCQNQHQDCQHAQDGHNEQDRQYRYQRWYEYSRQVWSPACHVSGQDTNLPHDLPELLWNQVTLGCTAAVPCCAALLCFARLEWSARWCQGYSGRWSMWVGVCCKYARLHECLYGEQRKLHLFEYMAGPPCIVCPIGAQKLEIVLWQVSYSGIITGIHTNHWTRKPLRLRHRHLFEGWFWNDMVKVTSQIRGFIAWSENQSELFYT